METNSHKKNYILATKKNIWGNTFTFKKTRMQTKLKVAKQLKSENQINRRRRGNVLKAGRDVTETQTSRTNNWICSPAARGKSAVIFDGKNYAECVFLKFMITEQRFALFVE